MQGIMDNSAALDIPRADIEVEMLSRYTASRNVKAVWVGGVQINGQVH